MLKHIKNITKTCCISVVPKFMCRGAPGRSELKGAMGCVKFGGETRHHLTSGDKASPTGVRRFTVSTSPLRVPSGDIMDLWSYVFGGCCSMKREPCEANVEWEARFEVVADSRIEKLCSTKKDTHLINKLWWLFKNEILFFFFQFICILCSDSYEVLGRRYPLSGLAITT